MITTDRYYEIYASDLKIEIDEAKSKLDSYRKTRTYFVGQLKAYKDTIHKYCDLTFEEIIDSTLAKVLEQYDMCMYSLTGGIQLSRDEAVRITTGIIEANRLIWRAEEAVKKLQERLVDKKSYKLFLRTLNELLKQAIIYKGYEFNFTGHASSIFVQRKKRYIRDDKAEGLTTVHNNAPIDWGASNKKKKEILDRGGVPRKGDNGGEDWLTTFTDDYGYWISWDKKKCHLPNKGLYSFEPARGVVLEVQKAKNDESIVANYIIG